MEVTLENLGVGELIGSNKIAERNGRQRLLGRGCWGGRCRTVQGGGSGAATVAGESQPQIGSVWTVRSNGRITGSGNGQRRPWGGVVDGLELVGDLLHPPLQEHGVSTAATIGSGIDGSGWAAQI